MTNLEKQLIEESKTEVWFEPIITDKVHMLRHVNFLDDSKEAKEIFKKSYEHKAGEYLLLKDSKGRKVVISEVEGPVRS